jgi:hypothetical protein
VLPVLLLPLLLLLLPVLCWSASAASNNISLRIVSSQVLDVATGTVAKTLPGVSSFFKLAG